MRGLFKDFAVSAILFATVIQPACAGSPAVTPLQQSFDWQAAWGGIQFSGTNDPVIPAAQFQPKADIKNAVSTYGTDNTPSALSTIATYNVDLNGDGVQDILLDGSAYIQQYGKADSPLCNHNFGCYLTIYTAGQPTNIITAPPTSNYPACPESAAKNKDCLSYCAADVKMCPANFQYTFHTLFDTPVFSWNVISTQDFTNMIAARGMSIYHGVVDENPVFVATMNDNYCVQEEIAANNNQCIKYYQYVPAGTGGAFSDLYISGQVAGITDSNTLYTQKPFSRSLAGLEGMRGTIFGQGTGYKLNAHGGTLDIQFANFVRTNPDGSKSPPAYTTFHIVNNASDNYFIPTNTDVEFSSFLNNCPKDVVITPALLQFTAWSSPGICPKTVVNAGNDVVLVDYPCPASGIVTLNNNCEGDGQACNYNVTCSTDVTTSAERFCQNSTSAYRDCSECVNAKAPVEPIPNGNGVDSSLYEGDYKMACFKQVACPSVVTGIGFAYHCLAGETKVSLPDGTTKNLDKIQAGDTVLGFKKANGSLKPVQVKAVAVTKNERSIKINNLLQLTEDHIVVTAKGEQVVAKSLKIGDKLLMDNGKKMKVKSVEAVADKGTVYNLQLDGAVGFVAGGIRVMSMPHQIAVSSSK